MACVLHARHRGIFAGSIESVGKQARDESGKHPVNEDDEEIDAHLRAKLATSPASSNSLYCAEAFGRHCERSEAIHRAAQRMDGLLRCAGNDGSYACAKT